MKVCRLPIAVYELHGYLNRGLSTRDRASCFPAGNAEVGLGARIDQLWYERAISYVFQNVETSLDRCGSTSIVYIFTPHVLEAGERREVETSNRYLSATRHQLHSPRSAFDIDVHSNALRHLPCNAHISMSSAQSRLDNIKQSLNPPMSQPINNEIKGRLALVTGASGGYVIEEILLRKQTLTHQTITASAQHAPATSGPTAPRSP